MMHRSAAENKCCKGLPFDAPSLEVAVMKTEYFPGRPWNAAVNREKWLKFGVQGAIKPK